VKGRFFILRHGETVFNAAARIQGDAAHTPLTRAGFAQAEAMGERLRAEFGPKPPLALWSSPAGRALQTLAVIAEHLELDWHSVRIDERLAEMTMGEWSGLYYCDLFAEHGPFVDPVSGLFTRPAPGGEWYDAVAARLSSWVAEQREADGDRLVVMHGMSSRVLRGLLTGLSERNGFGCPVAHGLPQGSVVVIENGTERLLHRAADSRAAPA
jgi:glucosyl-3-phosphoglycerate phosphatase